MKRIEKSNNYLFLNTGLTETPEWSRARTSTDFAIAMNGATETFDFIADKSPSTDLNSYSPTIAQTQTAYQGDKVFDYIFKMFKGVKVGAEAITDVMVVFEQKEDSAHEAWKSEALITVETYDIVAKTITYSISIRGTIEQGTATIGVNETPIFTPAV